MHAHQSILIIATSLLVSIRPLPFSLQNSTTPAVNSTTSFLNSTTSSVNTTTTLSNVTLPEPIRVNTSSDAGMVIFEIENNNVTSDPVSDPLVFVAPKPLKIEPLNPENVLVVSESSD